MPLCWGRSQPRKWSLLGPTITASTMIRSPSNSNELSDLIRPHDAREPQFASASMSASDRQMRAPRVDLIQRFLDRTMVTDYSCRPDGALGFMFAFDETNSFIGVPNTD